MERKKLVRDSWKKEREAFSCIESEFGESVIQIWLLVGDSVENCFIFSREFMPIMNDLLRRRPCCC